MGIRIMDIKALYNNWKHIFVNLKQNITFTAKDSDVIMEVNVIKVIFSINSFINHEVFTQCTGQIMFSNDEKQGKKNQ